MTNRSVAGVIGLLAFLAGGPAGAQSPLVVDLGISAVRFIDDNTEAIGPTVRASVTGVRGNGFLTAAGGGVVTFGAASGFALIAGGLRHPVRRGWAGEAAAELSSVGSSQRSGSATTAEASVRSLWNAGLGVAWLRSSTHLSGRSHGALGGAGLDAGVWWRIGPSQISIAARHEWTRAELFANRLRTSFVGTTAVRYSEANIALHAESNQGQLDFAATARHDAGASQTIAPAYVLNVARSISPRVTVVFAASRQLPDWIHGADALDAVSVGMRLRQPAGSSGFGSARKTVVSVSDSGAVRVLQVRSGNARTVEIMGDFTDWSPRTLMRRGEVHELPLALSSGSHRIMVRLDGGPWRVPANTPSVDDEFGHQTGLMVVP